MIPMRSTNRKVEIDKRLHITHLMMRTLGCRLLDSDTAKIGKADICIRLFVMSAICIITIPSMTAIAEYLDDLRYLSEVFSNVITASESIFSLVSFYHLEEKYRDLFRMIRQEFWSEPLSPVFYEYFRIFDRIATGINRYLVSVGFLALIFYYSVPLWSNNFDLYADIDAMRRTPFITKYYYDQRVSPNYEITYLCQMIGSFFTINAYIGLTSVYAFICMHVCAKLRIFQVKLNLIGASTSDADFVKIICEHRYLIRFANDVEELYAPVLLFHIVLSTLLICLNVVKVTSVSVRDGKLEFLLFTVYFAATFFQIFVFCWMANELFTEKYQLIRVAILLYQANLSQSEKLPTAAYCSGWYEASRNIQRGVLLIITRAQRPNVLTAGNFFAITLASFGSVCSKAVSYYTLLMSME